MLYFVQLVGILLLWYHAEYERGTLHLRGYLFTILRKNRVRVTYRYGGENFAGDSEIPLDVADAIIKMASIEIMNTSFRMDELPSNRMLLADVESEAASSSGAHTGTKDFESLDRIVSSDAEEDALGGSHNGYYDCWAADATVDRDSGTWQI